MTILLVEDETSLASFIRKGVESEGYDIKVAFDGLIGQHLFDQQPFDVVVLDVSFLPEELKQQFHELLSSRFAQFALG